MTRPPVDPQGGAPAPLATARLAPTQECVTHLEPDEVFVFGSNYAGRHGRGAALTAMRKFGAHAGQGMGMMGQSYSIATKGWRLDVLPLDKIQVQVARFLRYATAHPEKTFLVTEVGCGLAGYHPRHITPLFGQAIPPNVRLPASFLVVLGQPDGAGPGSLTSA